MYLYILTLLYIGFMVTKTKNYVHMLFTTLENIVLSTANIVTTPFLLAY